MVTVSAVLDNTAPAAPTIYELPDKVNTQTITISGLAEKGALVTITNDTDPYNRQLGENENTFSLTIPLAQGVENSISVTATDPASNTSQSTTVVVEHIVQLATTITVNVPSSITYGDSLKVDGFLKSDDGTPIAGKIITLTFTAPSAATFEKTTSATDSSGYYYLNTSELPDSAGTWSVSADWGGDLTYAAPETATATLVAEKADTTISVTAVPPVILKGDKVDIAGMLSSEPETNTLGNKTIKLVIHDPEGNPVTPELTATSYDNYGHYLLDDYAGFNKEGNWKVYAAFAGDENYNPSPDSPEITVTVKGLAGYAVLVSGKINNEEGIASHTKTTNRIYNTLTQDRGFLAENVKYFNYSGDKGGTTPVYSEIKDALTNWASAKMTEHPAPLYVILVDHGYADEDTGIFYLDLEQITSLDLKDWLETLEENLAGSGVNQDIIVIVGACYSGSFIKELSKPGRIIITSSAQKEHSYKGPMEPDGVRGGEYFMEELFKELGMGSTLKKSFDMATLRTKIFTDSGSPNSPAPFFDTARQHPLVDDNGDGIGTNNFKRGKDGDKVKDITLGVGPNAPTSVYIANVNSDVSLEPTSSEALLSAELSNNNQADAVWIEVREPDFLLSEGAGTGQLNVSLPSQAMTLEDTSWHVTYDGFTKPGKYTIFYFARDKDTGDISPFKESFIYKNISDNQAPDPFNLLFPADGDYVATSCTLRWEQSADPDGDTVTYTLIVSSDETFATVDYTQEGIDQCVCFIEYDDGLLDATTYYWKVIAKDSYGNATETDVWSFTTDNANVPFPGFLCGKVVEAATSTPISGATVVVTGMGPATTLPNGYYLIALPPGTYDVTIMAQDYDSSSDSVTITAGNSKILDTALSSYTDPPAADAGPDQTVDEGVSVTLDGSNSTDPDDGIASYVWEQTGGPSVTLSDPWSAQPTFTSPDVGPDGASLTFQLTVTDSGGLQSTDTCIVNINPVEVTKGDCNRDGKVDLADAVLALQVLAGIAPSVPIYDEADVNGDQRIGLEEVIYVLQKVAELRN